MRLFAFIQSLLPDDPVSIEMHGIISADPAKPEMKKRFFYTQNIESHPFNNMSAEQPVVKVVIEGQEVEAFINADKDKLPLLLRQLKKGLTVMVKKTIWPDHTEEYDLVVSWLLTRFIKL